VHASSGGTSPAMDPNKITSQLDSAYIPAPLRLAVRSWQQYPAVRAAANLARRMRLCQAVAQSISEELM
jgi:hypothetical protein